MKKIIDFVKRFTFTEIVGLLTIVLGAILFCFVICGAVKNAHNAISEGTIIDKDYNAAQTYTEYHFFDGKTIPQAKYIPARYVFTIKGNKNGETVEYTFVVSESEYVKYKVGDYYKK